MENDQLGLISHDLMVENLANTIIQLKDKIIAQGNKPHTTLKGKYFSIVMAKDFSIPKDKKIFKFLAAF